MDKKLEQKSAAQIGRKLAEDLKGFGFRKTKTAFYTRVRPDRIEFVYLNKLASGPYFRVQIGIRFLCDPFPVVALEGICSDDDREYRIRMSYTREPESLDRCAEAILDYVRERGEPWLAYWTDEKRLLREEGSPILRFKEEYARSAEKTGEGFEQAAALSRMLLGIKP
ncbi:hypothetical protein CDO73_01780 [Saccharibacillus sp. O23]|uniref:hypothetical protein n=1 Tax=Saccharibacillus sp. O23 TaxID=2009338 RepID=UPI000B4E5130|nr:hypothetical protein [Saccharibacillus sp. O23]OWR32365.1 hypothetical protein CDO73_01780 [Saccharibacillus sp. O23]